MKQIVADRRALHRVPELDRALNQTLAYLRAALKPLDCRVFSPIPGALCAYFDRGAATTLAFRSDADALPVQEETHLPFASEHAGKMHACGHDGHMAMLLELARRLHGRPAGHNFLLIFQPAEETTGGARDICESGVLEAHRVEAVFGMHLWPGLEKGRVASRPNEMMSRSCEVTVEIIGRSSHIARADEGRDALMAGVEFLCRAREIERSYPPEVFRLLRFGHMQSGSVRNAISAHSRIEGSLRAFQDEIFDSMLNGVKAACEQLERETLCRFQLTTSQGYPAVMNPPELYQSVRRCGISFDELAKPMMITEDFSWYQRWHPGLFFLLGVGDAPALHASNFDFDEGVLETGADFWEQLALTYR